MTKKIKDLAVKVGSYQKGGETKNRYINIGSILEKDDGGKFMILDRTFNPAGVPNPDNKDTLIVSMFDIGDKEEKNKTSDTVKPNPVDTDEIPF